MTSFIKRLLTIRHPKAGFSLVEVLVGVSILSLVGVAGLSAVSTTSKVTIQTNSRTTARSLAVSEMDSVLAADYIYAAAGGLADYSFTAPPSGYSISTLDRSGNQVSSKIYGLPWDVATAALYAGADPIDPGVQKITIIVKYNSQEILRLADFKANR